MQDESNKLSPYPSIDLIKFVQGIDTRRKFSASDDYPNLQASFD